MNLIAFEKALEHLELAKVAASKLTLDSGVKAYELAWRDFLAEASRIYSKLESGSKGNSKSEPWFAKKKHDRKKDPLLQYIHQARDAAEHGFHYVTRTRARGGTISFPKTQEVSVSMHVKMNEDGTMDIRNPTVKTPEGEFNQMLLEEPRVELVKVLNRGRWYDPPEMHLGKPIVGRTPASIAALAIGYLGGLLGDAGKLPKDM
jgi:hypothetical protein